MSILSVEQLYSRNSLLSRLVESLESQLAVKNKQIEAIRYHIGCKSANYYLLLSFLQEKERKNGLPMIVCLEERIMAVRSVEEALLNKMHVKTEILAQSKCDTLYQSQNMQEKNSILQQMENSAGESSKYEELNRIIGELELKVNLLSERLTEEQKVNQGKSRRISQLQQKQGENKKQIQKINQRNEGQMKQFQKIIYEKDVIIAQLTAYTSSEKIQRQENRNKECIIDNKQNKNNIEQLIKQNTELKQQNCQLKDLLSTVMMRNKTQQQQERIEREVTLQVAFYEKKFREQNQRLNQINNNLQMRLIGNDCLNQQAAIEQTILQTANQYVLELEKYKNTINIYVTNINQLNQKLACLQQALILKDITIQKYIKQIQQVKSNLVLLKQKENLIKEQAKIYEQQRKQHRKNIQIYQKEVEQLKEQIRRQKIKQKDQKKQKRVYNKQYYDQLRSNNSTDHIPLNSNSRMERSSRTNTTQLSFTTTTNQLQNQMLKLQRENALLNANVISLNQKLYNVNPNEHVKAYLNDIRKQKEHETNISNFFIKIPVNRQIERVQISASSECAFKEKELKFGEKIIGKKIINKK